MVFADAGTKEGKELLADTYEQMGYQAESGPWRSVYLMGAFELRNGVPNAGGFVSASPDTIKAMPPEMTFDYFAVRLNGEKAAGNKIALNIEFTDLKKLYSLMIENGVLNHAPKAAANADAKIALSVTLGTIIYDIRRDGGCILRDQADAPAAIGRLPSRSGCQQGALPGAPWHVMFQEHVLHSLVVSTRNLREEAHDISRTRQRPTQSRPA